MKHFLLITAFSLFLLVTYVNPQSDSGNRTTTRRNDLRRRRDHRGRKAQLVRQLMRSRVEEGAVRLVDGAHEHEGDHFFCPYCCRKSLKPQLTGQ